MLEPHELLVGRVYFDIYCEDKNLRYPFNCGRTEGWRL